MTDVPLSFFKSSMYPSHFVKSSTMPQSTNLISNDDSMQAEALGTACLVSIIGTINILLIVLDWMILYKRKCRRSLMKHIQRKQHTLHSLKLEYGYLF